MIMLALWVPGWPELVLIGLVVLLFFGAKRIPELTRAILVSARELRSGIKGDHPAPHTTDTPAADSTSPPSSMGTSSQH
jgi:TatA/E family protein of Tat protein translocase